jgi:hypothetical protein
MASMVQPRSDHSLLNHVFVLFLNISDRLLVQQHGSAKLLLLKSLPLPKASFLYLLTTFSSIFPREKREKHGIAQVRNLPVRDNYSDYPFSHTF